MPTRYAILSLLAVLFSCSGYGDDDREVYAWSEDGVTYWEGESAVTLSADPAEKNLRHRNGHNKGNSGAQGSCGSLASTSVWCRLMTEDKGVWAYIHPGAGPVSAGLYSGENRLLNQGVDVVNAPNASSADVEIRSVAAAGVDWTLTCTDFDLRAISTPDGSRTIEICMHWELDVAGQRPGEGGANYSVRMYRTGIIALGSILGLKASPCGGAMAMSVVSSSFAYPDYCQQQKDLIAAFQPWYSGYSYSYTSSVPSGL